MSDLLARVGIDAEVAAATRLRLVHPRLWTAVDAAEVRNCRGACWVTYDGSTRVVHVVAGCKAHGRVAS